MQDSWTADQLQHMRRLVGDVMCSGNRTQHYQDLQRHQGSMRCRAENIR